MTKNNFPISNKVKLIGGLKNKKLLKTQINFLVALTVLKGDHLHFSIDF